MRILCVLRHRLASRLLVQEGLTTERIAWLDPAMGHPRLPDFRSFRDRIDQLRDHVELDAEVNLALDVVREPLRHSLALRLRSTATYRLLDGEELKFVEGSGVVVPARVELGEIAFRAPEQAGGGIARLDEAWGTVVACASAFLSVFGRAEAAIRALEAHHIDIRRLCPRARTDRSGPLQVSVESYWDYFLRFAHEGAVKARRHYNSASDAGAERPLWLIR